MRVDTIARPLDGDATHARAFFWVGIVLIFGYNVVDAVGVPGSQRSDRLLALGTVGLVGLLHLRHALAVTQGVRPVGWALTLGVMVAGAWIVPVTQDLFLPNTAFLLGASAALLVPHRWVAATCVATIIGNIAVITVSGHLDGLTRGRIAWEVTYGAVVWLLGILGLFATTLVVLVLDRNRSVNAEIEAVAVGTERMRISRDLHDTVGATLTAIALKADVARRLYPSDPTAAAAQINELADLAATTTDELGTTTGGRQLARFTDELDASVALLHLAGIATNRPNIECVPNTATDHLLGWVVREGIANVLRHSDATHCEIDLTNDHDTLRLTIRNDGVNNRRGQKTAGTGLAGLRERAAAHNGSVRSGIDPAGWFMLEVEVTPRPTAPPAPARTTVS